MIDQEEIMQELYPQLNLMEIYEHWQMANNDHIEQVFDIFDGLKKGCQENELILNRRYEELSNITALIDPDKFPIFSLIDVVDSQDIVSLWSYKPETLRSAAKNIGFSLEVKQSLLEHHEAGEGVFLKIDEQSDFASHQQQCIPVGSLLGLLPGLVFDSLKEFENYHQKHMRELDEFIHRFDDTVIDFSSKIIYPSDLANNMVDLKQIIDERHKNNPQDNYGIHNVFGEMVNPYAVGHKINHPPKDTRANVIFQDIFIPIHFFPEKYLKFMPNLRVNQRPSTWTNKGKSELDFFDNKRDFIRTIGVFALRNIQDGEELYVNYFDNNMYDVEEVRDWLKRPPPLSPYFTKQEYESEFTLLARIIDSFLIKKYASLYTQFQYRVSHDPNRHAYESDKQDQEQEQKKSEKKQLGYFQQKIKDFDEKQKESNSKQQ